VAKSDSATTVGNTSISCSIDNSTPFNFNIPHIDNKIATIINIGTTKKTRKTYLLNIFASPVSQCSRQIISEQHDFRSSDRLRLFLNNSLFDEFLFLLTHEFTESAISDIRVHHDVICRLVHDVDDSTNEISLR